MERGQSDSPSQNGSTGSGRSTPNSESSPGKLFVGGLSWQTTPEKLKEYFSQFGAITDVLVMKDPVTQVKKDIIFGFVFLATLSQVVIFLGFCGENPFVLLHFGKWNVGRKNVKRGIEQKRLINFSLCS